MATMAERKMQSVVKEIEKLEKSLERYEGRLAKKIEKCEKLNCNWTREQFFKHRDVDMTGEQYVAWSDAEILKDDVKDTKRRIENAKGRLEKLTGKVEKIEAERTENERVAGIGNAWIGMSREELHEQYEKWLAEFKAECAKDGITIEEATSRYITGTTASGKWFTLYGNNGFTDRSWHCYTLTIDGEAIFTSGDFGTAYNYLKK